MKTELNFIELKVLVQEFQLLVGARLDQVYQNGEEFLFQFHKPVFGKLLLKVTPKFAWLTARKVTPEEVPAFCSLLRKHLSGLKVKKVEQLAGERIFKMTFESAKLARVLFVELFSQGNMVLCDERNAVVAAKIERAWKDRAIRKGLPYALPPTMCNLFGLSEKQFLEIFKIRTSVSRTLALMGLGKTFALEACLTAKVGPEQVSITGEQAKALYMAVRELFERKPSPRVYFKDGKVFDISPFELQQYAGLESKSYKTFSQALDENIQAVSPAEQAALEQYLRKRERLLRMIAAQEESIARLEKVAEEGQRKGELIYSNYHLLKPLLEELKELRKKHSWEEIKARLKEHKLIKDINEKTGEVVVELT